MLIKDIEILLEQVIKKTQAMRFILEQNLWLKEILYTEDENLRKKAQELGLKLDNLIGSQDWAIYDYSAVIIQLYAVYENFVEELIRKWLKILPKLVTKYGELEKNIQDNHRKGVGNLLIEVGDQNRYKDLKTPEILQKLLDGINNKKNYELIPEAFLIRHNNFREGELKNTFTKVGINGDFVWTWLENHQNMKKYIDEILGEQNTLKKELDEFIERRNEVAHRLMKVQENILGYDNLRNLCFFIEAICQGLADAVIYHFLMQNIELEKCKEIGKVTNFLSNKKVIIASIYNVNLSVGDEIFIVNANSSYCKSAKVIELRNSDEESQQTLEVKESQDVSLQVEINAIQNPRKDQKIYLLKK